MSAFSQKLSQKQLQTLSLSYGMKLSLDLLQMNSLKLQEYLEKELMDNPMYEVDVCMNYGGSEEMDAWEIPDESRSLQKELLLQINDQRCNMAIIEEILHHCDRNGYLLIEKQELAKQLLISLQELQYHLERIHDCEPYGLAAENLSECLYVQLQHQEVENELAKQLVLHHLEDIAKNRMEKLAQLFHVAQAEILKAIQLIQTLDPRPASCYDITHIQFVKPDVMLERDGDQIQIIMPHYFHIQEQEYDKGYVLQQEDKAYIKEKRAQGKAILECLEHRKDTLYAIMQVLVNKQIAYLRHEDHLQYFIMKDIGEALSMHETTISRAMKDKYISFEGSVYPMSTLLCKQVHDTSVACIVANIQECIDQEDVMAPLSDQRLSLLLKERGILCSRRTIASYRTKLQIPSAQTRKRLKEKKHE